jgi:cytochrome c-type biogenesis protein CcmH/NrfF
MSSFAHAARRIAALLAVLATLASALAPVAFAAPASQADIEDEVMCVQCERPLVTSSGSAADDQRQLISDWIDEGLTKPQIKARLVAEYGERALVDDRSPIAASAPWVAALVGAASIALLLRRRQQTGGAAGAAAGTTPAGAAASDLPAREVSAADQARIDAELAELE